MWFQNRRAKYRKQEKQLQKALSSPAVIPSCSPGDDDEDDDDDCDDDDEEEDDDGDDDHNLLL